MYFFDNYKPSSILKFFNKNYNINVTIFFSWQTLTIIKNCNKMALLKKKKINTLIEI